MGARWTFKGSGKTAVSGNETDCLLISAGPADGSYYVPCRRQPLKRKDSGIVQGKGQTAWTGGIKENIEITDGSRQFPLWKRKQAYVVCFF